MQKTSDGYTFTLSEMAALTGAATSLAIEAATQQAKPRGNTVETSIEACQDHVYVSIWTCRCNCHHDRDDLYSGTADWADAVQAVLMTVEQRGLEDGETFESAVTSLPSDLLMANFERVVAERK